MNEDEFLGNVALMSLKIIDPSQEIDESNYNEKD